jgi:DNA-binding MarR family transcriptional regulator
VTEDVVAGIVEQWARERPDLDAAPMLVIGRLLRLGHVLDVRLRPPFAATDLANGDFDVLAALRRAGTPFTARPVDLSRSLLVTTGAITKRLDRLEAQGYVERESADGDGRGKLVRLTPTGRETADRLIAVHLANQDRLLAGLTGPERDRLATLLGRLAGALEREDEPP